MLLKRQSEETAYLMHAIISVLLLPPIESWSMRVSLESLDMLY